jgi:hypothetical protein
MQHFFEKYQGKNPTNPWIMQGATIPWKWQEKKLTNPWLKQHVPIP